MSEVGTGAPLRAALGSAAAFCSWLRLCPDTRLTGGKLRKNLTRPRRSHRALGRFALSLRGRLGKAEGITATAHQLARIVHGLLVSGEAYDEKLAFQLTPAKAARALQDLQRRAQKLGFQLGCHRGTCKLLFRSAALP